LGVTGLITGSAGVAAGGPVTGTTGALSSNVTVGGTLGVTGATTGTTASYSGAVAVGSITQDAWTAVTPSSGWTTLGGYGALQCRKDREGYVHIRGSLTGGTFADGTTIATLAVGFRPLTAIPVPVTAAQGTGASPQCVIGTGGTMVIFGITSNASLHINCVIGID
jgi:hypothetical protein